MAFFSSKTFSFLKLSVRSPGKVAASKAKIFLSLLQKEKLVSQKAKILLSLVLADVPSSLATIGQPRRRGGGDNDDGAAGDPESESGYEYDYSARYRKGGR